jgi:S1-C subfamily serine protease
MKKLLLGFVLVSVTVGFVGGLAAGARIADRGEPRDDAPGMPAAPQRGQPQPRPAALPAAGTLPDLSSVAEAALQVSANITSTNIVRRTDPWSMFFFDEPQFDRLPSAGSGVVVSPDGLILTNTHVIGSVNAKVRVTLSDGQERAAEIIGLDELSDLTVLKVNASGLPTLPWGDSSRLRVAEWVLAIGNPFQLSGTVTLGIVSNPSRSQSGGVTDFIQTDAAINQGNSGGALVNARGELVGINSMIYTETGGNLGIGFAIPSNLARRIMSELIENGSVRWGSIGYVQWIEPAVARRYGIDVNGLVIVRMDQGSSAYRAGLRAGDVLVSFNGQKPQTREELESLIARAGAGSRATFEIDRNGRRVSVTVPVESRQQQQPRIPRR